MNRNLNILNQFNILYIEDDKDLLKHTKDILEDFSKEVFAVSTSKDAYEILDVHKIDIIICDILLENENGIDFLKDLKEKKEIFLPCILATAHTDTKYLLEAIKLKIENYIVKPINVKELLNTLHDILLPQIQKKELQKNNNVIKTISAITDSKQVEIIKYIINKLDKNNQLFTSYSEIMEEINVSKPTLIKLFKDLSSKNILNKTAHKTYYFDEKALNTLNT